jgi:23S rRNA (uracil1939-C5)-methyltransferase
VSEILELTVDRPVAGGRMIARDDGQIVFVSGAIPGERVRARVERKSKQLRWAATVDVLTPSPDRRAVPYEPACGGSSFAHIQYDRQRELKQQILVDAFRRIARITLDSVPAVAPSPERGYRLRARLHAKHGQLGFFLEGTHAICDAAATAQLLPEATAAGRAVFSALGPRSSDCEAIVVSENVAGTERVVHLEPRDHARLDDVADAIRAAADGQGRSLTGVTTVVRGNLLQIVGTPSVRDTAESLFGDSSPLSASATWTRRAPSFFQGNRYLVGALVRRVLETATGSRLADLYAGVGLFAVALAANGAHVTAVEGESFAAEDLKAHAQPFGSRIDVVQATVEDAVQRPLRQAPDAVVLDPPRTGVSPQALSSVVAWRTPTLIYVSCDPPTLARDAAKIVAAGYTLASLDAFDLFPNTPHVESVALFTRS